MATVHADAIGPTVAWTLVEPCCGTAALTMASLGGRSQLVPRQGSKWSVRKHLLPLFPEGVPERIRLSDSAPWSTAMAVVLSGDRTGLLLRLEDLIERGGRDPQGLFRELCGAPVPGDSLDASAQLLWLQRMAFSGKAVQVTEDGRWSSPGLNTTSAYGTPGTSRFGPVRPLGPALLRAVRAAPRHDHVESTAGLLQPPDHCEPGTHVYLDPPYKGRTGYGPDDLTRRGVVYQALGWSLAGARVVVSEATAVQELVDRGWSARRLCTASGGDAHLEFRARHRDEWVTCNWSV